MAEHHSQRVHTEDVVLDIGDGIGGLIFYTCEELCGQEIEILGPEMDPRQIHCEVDRRVVNGRTLFAGVFPPLPEGDYRVSRPESRAAQHVRVASGCVTEMDWRGGDRAG